MLRRALKPEKRADAAKRDESHIKFTQWKDGRPAGEWIKFADPKFIRWTTAKENFPVEKVSGKRQTT